MPMSDYMRDLRAKLGSRLLIMPSASVALRDDEGRVLLARHAAAGIWSFPGGAVEPLETPADAAVREVWEELGVVVELSRLVGVYAGPHFVVRYENGDETAYLAVLFEGRLVRGTPRPDGEEILEVRWVNPSDLGALRLSPWLKEAVADLVGGGPAGFRRPTWAPPE